MGPFAHDGVRLLLILALAAALRFSGLGWGIPRYDPELRTRAAARTSFHPDEDRILWQLDSMRLRALDLDPKDFGWGTLQTYLVGATMFAGDRAGAFGTGWRSSFRGAEEPGFSRVFVAGRAVSALFGVLTVGVVFAIGKEAGGSAAGMLSALLLSVSPLHVLHSHYLTTDVALTLWIAVSVWLCKSHPSIAGLALGLAMATKPSAVVLTPILLLTPRAPTARAKSLVWALVGFLVGEPYALLSLGQWWPATKRVLVAVFGSGAESFSMAELMLRHVAQLGIWGVGPIAGLLALVGLAASPARLRLTLGLLVSTLALSRFPMARYELPLLPFLAVAAGVALAHVPRRARAATAALAIAWPATVSTAHDELLLEPHPMQQAADWIVRNVEADRSVARLWAEYPLLDPARYRLELLHDAFQFQTAPYRPLSADVVVLDDLPLHPWRRDLLADLAASYVEAVRFTARPAVFGVTLPEPFLPHDSRYTRPDVRIYRRSRPGGS